MSVHDSDGINEAFEDAIRLAASAGRRLAETRRLAHASQARPPEEAVMDGSGRVSAERRREATVALASRDHGLHPAHG